MRRRPAFGVTLVELMTVLAILAVVLALGIPSFNLLKSQFRARGASHLLSTSFARARMTAILRRVPVAVCPIDAAGKCRSDGIWDHGWIVYLDPDRNGRPDDPADVLEMATPGSAAPIRSPPSRSQTRFLPDGRASGSNLTLRICSDHPQVPETRLILSNAGRLRIERHAAAGQACGGA